MVRPEKEIAVAELADIFSEARAVYFTDFQGLDVEGITDLRKRFRESSISYRIVKNTLVKLAVERVGYGELEKSLEGPTGIAYTYQDVVVPVKILVDFARDKEKPKIKSGLVEGKVIDADQVLAISKLPSKEELLAQMLGGVQAPLRSLILNLQGIQRKLVMVIQAYADRQREGEG